MRPSASMMSRLAITLALVSLATSGWTAEVPRAKGRKPVQQVSVPSPEPAQADLPQSLAPRRAYFGEPKAFTLTAGSQPSAMIAAADGAIWFTAPQVGAIGRLDRVTGAVSYTPLGNGAKPYSLTEGRDRAVYAVDRALNVLHRLAPETNEVTRIALPPETPFLDLSHVRVDMDGRIWFAGAGGWLGSHDPVTGKTDVSSHDDLAGLAYGATTTAGTIWFISGKAGRMIHVDPLRARFDSARLPAQLKGVRGVAAGPSGEIWMSFMQSHAIARYAGRGNWHVVALPWVESLPQAVVVRSDGTLVIADAGRRKLLRYDPIFDRFDEVGELGSGGAVKAILDLGDAIAVADMGSDRITIFPDDPPKGN